MAEEKIKIAPHWHSCVDDDHTKLFVEIILPGVDKKDINLNMHDDSLSLSAPRKNMEYAVSLSFCCPVNPDKANAKYNNGLLEIEIPFRSPMEDAIKVPVK